MAFAAYFGLLTIHILIHLTGQSHFRSLLTQALPTCGLSAQIVMAAPVDLSAMTALSHRHSNPT